MLFNLYCSYYAIVHPIRAQYMCTLSQAKKVITTTWMLSFLLASPTLLIQVSNAERVVIDIVINGNLL